MCGSGWSIGEVSALCPRRRKTAMWRVSWGVSRFTLRFANVLLLCTIHNYVFAISVPVESNILTTPHYLMYHTYEFSQLMTIRSFAQHQASFCARIEQLHLDTIAKARHRTSRLCTRMQVTQAKKHLRSAYHTGQNQRGCFPV